MRNWLNRTIEWLLALVLIAVGLLGSFHEVLHRVGLEIKNPDAFTLRIVGLLALALGLERFTRFAQVEQHFSSLEKQFRTLHEDITARLPVQVVDGYDNVFDRLGTLMRTSDVSMRSLIYSNVLPFAPERFFTSLIEHLKRHPRVTYHITIAANLADFTEDYWRIVAERDARMADAGIIRGQLRRTFLNIRKPVGLDVLVVDDNHCFMAICPAAPADSSAVPHAAFIFENQPAVVMRVRTWLDNLEPLLLEQNEAQRMWEKRQKAKPPSGEMER